MRFIITNNPHELLVRKLYVVQDRAVYLLVIADSKEDALAIANEQGNKHQLIYSSSLGGVVYKFDNYRDMSFEDLAKTGVGIKATAGPFGNWNKVGNWQCCS